VSKLCLLASQPPPPCVPPEYLEYPASVSYKPFAVVTRKFLRFHFSEVFYLPSSCSVPPKASLSYYYSARTFLLPCGDGPIAVSLFSRPGGTNARTHLSRSVFVISPYYLALFPSPPHVHLRNTFPQPFAIAIATSIIIRGAERRLPRGCISAHLKSHFAPVSPFSSLLPSWVVLLLPCLYCAHVSFSWFPSLRFSVPFVLRPWFLDFLHPSLLVSALRRWIHFSLCRSLIHSFFLPTPIPFHLFLVFIFIS